MNSIAPTQTPVTPEAVAQQRESVRRCLVNEASASLRKIREWCDRTEQAVGARVAAGALAPEDLGLSRAVLIVRALLPPVPEAAEGVEQVDDARDARDDREYPA